MSEFPFCLYNLGLLDEKCKKLTKENFTRIAQGADIENAASSNKEDTDARDDDDRSVVDIIHLKIPGEKKERICSNCCAICLEAYKVNDIVVWSSSPDCCHVFHQFCLVEALSRAQNNDAPCPCCRIIFCDIQMERLRPPPTFLQRLQEQWTA